MPETDIWAIIGGLISLFIVGIVATMLLTALGEQQCQPYKDTISQKDAEILRLNSLLNSTNQQLGECNSKYDYLTKENITKKDFEDIKNYYNQTQIQISYLDQKFETINTNFYKTYNLFFKQYKISIALNVFFIVDLISFAFFKIEFVTYLFSLVFKLIIGRKSGEHKDGKQ